MHALSSTDREALVRTLSGAATSNVVIPQRASRTIGGPRHAAACLRPSTSLTPLFDATQIPTLHHHLDWSRNDEGEWNGRER